jgi:hypothetical protein
VSELSSATLLCLCGVLTLVVDIRNSGPADASADSSMTFKSLQRIDFDDPELVQHC